MTTAGDISKDVQHIILHEKNLRRIILDLACEAKLFTLLDGERPDNQDEHKLGLSK